VYSKKSGVKTGGFLHSLLWKAAKGGEVRKRAQDGEMILEGAHCRPTKSENSTNSERGRGPRPRTDSSQREREQSTSEFVGYEERPASSMKRPDKE